MSQRVWKARFQSRWTILGITAFTVATLLLLMALVDAVSQGNVAAGLTLMLPISMIAIGFPAGSAVHGGFRIDPTFPEVRSSRILHFMTIAAGAVLLTNLAVNISMELGATDVLGLAMVITPMQFSVAMAVGEEILFRYFLTRFFSNISTNFIAMLGSGSVFAVFHFWRYGFFPHLLLITFVAGWVLAWVYIESGMISAVILPHALINSMRFMSAPVLAVLGVSLIVFLVLSRGGRKR